MFFNNQAGSCENMFENKMLLHYSKHSIKKDHIKNSITI